MVAADKIILKPESIIKKPRETTTKSSDSSTLAEKNNVATLGHSMIEHVNGYEIWKILDNCKVLQVWKQIDIRIDFVLKIFWIDYM